MAMNAKRDIELFELKQSSGQLSLFLYFTEVPTINVHDKWVEKTSDLPNIIQQQLSTVDTILTECKKKGLYDRKSTIVLKGINFYDPELQSYSNYYVHVSSVKGAENMKTSSLKPPIFEDVEYQQGAAVIHINGTCSNDYIDALKTALQSFGIKEMRANQSSTLRM